MNGSSFRNQVSFSIIAIMFFLFMSGCSSSSSVTAPEMNDSMSSMSNTVASFDDIELPVEMKHQENKNMSIRNDTFRGGVYYYKGKVDVNSLKEFIIVSLKNNKWKLDGESVMKKESLLAFTKPNKTCMFIINDDVHVTKLTLVVTVNSAAANKMNPFGEPSN